MLEWLVTAGAALRESFGSSRNGARAVYSKVILLANNDNHVRRVLVDVLRKDYETIEARDGVEAVRIAARYPREIHLLMTDASLPDLTGWELGELIRLDHPGVRVICMGNDPRDRWRIGLKRTFSFVSLDVPPKRETVLQIVRAEIEARVPFINPGLTVVGASRSHCDTRPPRMIA